MGGSKCSSIANSSGANLPRCGCDLSKKLWVANTVQNPKRKFWKYRNNGFDSCDLLVWDDELDEVEDVNRKQRPETICKNCEFMKEFGREFGRELGKEIGKKIGQFAVVVIMMCVILFATLLKSM